VTFPTSSEIFIIYITNMHEVVVKAPLRVVWCDIW